ncbi:MAG: hypothetical protein JXB07_10695, partial [Anaerolineae bacterium]|nr:hypothetical protein [Anaerolineae bacterium]
AQRNPDPIGVRGNRWGEMHTFVFISGNSQPPDHLDNRCALTPSVDSFDRRLEPYEHRVNSFPVTVLWLKRIVDDGSTLATMLYIAGLEIETEKVGVGGVHREEARRLLPDRVSVPHCRRGERRAVACFRLP